MCDKCRDMEQVNRHARKRDNCIATVTGGGSTLDARVNDSAASTMRLLFPTRDIASTRRQAGAAPHAPQSMQVPRVCKALASSQCCLRVPQHLGVRARGLHAPGVTGSLSSHTPCAGASNRRRTAPRQHGAGLSLDLGTLPCAPQAQERPRHTHKRHHICDGNWKTMKHVWATQPEAQILAGSTTAHGRTAPRHKGPYWGSCSCHTRDALCQKNMAEVGPSRHPEKH